MWSSYRRALFFYMLMHCTALTGLRPLDAALGSESTGVHGGNVTGRGPCWDSACLSFVLECSGAVSMGAFK